jgi:hypothetical protein
VLDLVWGKAGERPARRASAAFRFEDRRIRCVSEVVTKALDAVYGSAAEDSHVDPELARMQNATTGPA